MTKRTIFSIAASCMLMLIGASAQIESGRPIAGRIAAAGQIDVYRIELEAGESLDVAIVETIGNTSFQPQIAIFSPGGSQLTWAFGNVSAGRRITAASSGIYRVEVGAYQGLGLLIGSYQVVVGKSPSSQNDPDGRHLRSGESVEQTLKLGDIDIFTIDMAAGGTLVANIGMRSPTEFFGPFLNLYAPDGTLVTSDNTIEHRNGTAGEYTIVVRDGGTDAAGPYRLSVATVPGAQHDSSGKELKDGDQIESYLKVGDLDVFTYHSAFGGSVRFSLTDTLNSSLFNPQIQVYRSNGQRVGSGVYEFGQGTVNFEPDLAHGGLYFIVISETDADSGGAYALSLTRTSGPIDAEHVSVLTHGFGNPSRLKFGFLTTPFEVGFPNFLDGWSTLAGEIESLPGQYGTSIDQATYVANWPSTDGWVQAVGAVFASFFVSGDWDDYLLRYAENEMDRAALHAEMAAERIVDDLDRAGLFTQTEFPEIHLVGHSRGAAVNARAARLLYQRGHTATQFTALDGYSTDWPGISSILADLSIVGETTGIPGMRKVNVRVEDGLDEFVVRAIVDAFEGFTRYVASSIGLPIPSFADQTVDELKQFTQGWKAPERPGFDNYVMVGCIPGQEFTNHINLTEAYTRCDRPSGLRALLDSPLGSDILGVLPSPVRGPRDNHHGGDSIPAGIKDGDFDDLGELAAGTAALAVPAAVDPVIHTFLTAMKQPEFILSSSWDITGGVSLIPLSGGYAARLEEGGNTAVSQMVKLGEYDGSIEFDLGIVNRRSGAKLEIVADEEVIGSVELGTAASGHFAMSLFGTSSRVTNIGFRLIGDSASPAVVTIDNVEITGAVGDGYPNLEIVQLGSNGVVTLKLIGSPGLAYRIQSSADLTTWTDIAEPVNFTGMTEIQHALPEGKSAMHYRVAR